MSGRGLPAAGVVCGTLALLLAGCSSGSSHTNPPAVSPIASTSAPPPVGSVEHPRPVDCADGRTGDPIPVEGPPSVTPSPDAAGAGARRAPGSGADKATKTPSAPAATGSTGIADPPGVPEAAGRSNVIVGPLTWPALRMLASGDQHAHGVQGSGGWHYPVITAVSPGRVVTVTVGASERARAGLEFGGRFSPDSGTAPAPAVTFHSCLTKETSFVGSFFVAGDGRACVPLDVQVGDAPARRVVISFFNGTCPA